MKYSIIIILSLLSFGYSKAMYADNGEYYSAFNFSYDSDRAGSGQVNSIHVEYSLISYNMDYSLGYTRGSFVESADSYLDYTFNGWSASGSYYIREPLINLSLEAGGMMTFMGSQYLDDLGLEMDGYGYNIGFNIDRSLIKRDAYEIIPFIGYVFMSSTSVLKDDLYRITENYQDTGFKVGLGIKIKSPWCDSNYIIAQPEAITIESYSNFSVTIGTLINIVSTCY